MDPRQIAKRSLKLVVFGIFTILVLKTIPYINLSDKEILVIISWIALVHILTDIFYDKVCRTM